MWWRYALGAGFGLVLAHVHGPGWFPVGLAWAFLLDLVTASPSGEHLAAWGVRRERA